MKNPFDGFNWAPFEKYFDTSIATRIDSHHVYLRCTRGAFYREMEVHPRIGEDLRFKGAVEFLYESIRHLSERVALDDWNAKDTTRASLHPANAAEYLVIARHGYEDLAKAADERGDVAGADAWRIAVDAIETALACSDRASRQQTWSEGLGKVRLSEGRTKGGL